MFPVPLQSCAGFCSFARLRCENKAAPGKAEGCSGRGSPSSCCSAVSWAVPEPWRARLALWDRTRHLWEQEMAWAQHQLLLAGSAMASPEQEQPVWLLMCLPQAGTTQAGSMGSKIQFCLHYWRPLAVLMWQLLPTLVLVWAGEGGALQVFIGCILCSTALFKRDLARMCTKLQTLVLTLLLKCAVPPV